MAFGESRGPTASSRRVNELLELLHDAGHADFRDARGPMGFTQRQASGTFTADEADAFIEELLAAQHEADVTARQAEFVAASRTSGGLDTFTDAQLAAELRRRGWTAVERC